MSVAYVSRLYFTLIGDISKLYEVVATLEAKGEINVSLPWDTAKKTVLDHTFVFKLSDYI